MLGWNAFWALFWALVFFSSCHHRGSWTVQQQILPHTPHCIRHHPVRNNGILRVQLIRNMSNLRKSSNTSGTLSPLHQGFRKLRQSFHKFSSDLPLFPQFSPPLFTNLRNFSKKYTNDTTHQDDPNEKMLPHASTL